jgi:hypothetical protein
MKSNLGAALAAVMCALVFSFGTAKGDTIVQFDLSATFGASDGLLFEPAADCACLRINALFLTHYVEATIIKARE